VGANHPPNTNPKIVKSQANFRILIESKYIHNDLTLWGAALRIRQPRQRSPGATNMIGQPPRLSIVVPCYNEEDVLPESANRLSDILA
jgi:hypothetical protein